MALYPTVAQYRHFWTPHLSPPKLAPNQNPSPSAKFANPTCPTTCSAEWRNWDSLYQRPYKGKLCQRCSRAAIVFFTRRSNSYTLWFFRCFRCVFVTKFESCREFWSSRQVLGRRWHTCFWCFLLWTLEDQLFKLSLWCPLGNLACK